MNFGARAREEVRADERGRCRGGRDCGKNVARRIAARFTYDAGGNITKIANVSADRDMTNVAPELGVVYTPTASGSYRARVGTGYGTPQFPTCSLRRMVSPETTRNSSRNATSASMSAAIGRRLPVSC